MILLSQVASEDFVSIDPGTPGAVAAELVRRLEPVQVVVQIGPDSGYVVAADALLRRLMEADQAASVGAVLDQGEVAVVPVLDAISDADAAPDCCLVADDGLIVGVFDVTSALPDRQRIGITRGMEPEPLPGPAGDSDLVSRLLCARFRERVALGTTHSLLISLSAENAPASALPIALARGAMVDIVVQSRRGFAVVGSSEGQLVVTDEEETLPIQVKLEATALGVGQIRVFAFHQGQPLGSLNVVAVVTEPAADAQVTANAEVFGPIMPVHSSPDLTMLILEQRHDGQSAIILRLLAQDPALGLNFKPFAPIVLKSDPFRFLAELFEEIERLRFDTPAARQASLARLAARGAWLFETLFPPELRVIAWSLRERIKTVQIQSEECWIPWEICKLTGPGDDGCIEEGPFFCEAFEISRWIPDIPRAPRLRLGNLALVAPGDSKLPFAPAECAYLLSLATAQRRVTAIPARLPEVMEALASGLYDGWHFTGHGLFHNAADPNRSGIVLEGGEELRPADLSGRVKNLGRLRPLVFLNACQAGRGGLSLTDIGGWAAQTLKAGAGGFIGAYWSIGDRAACEFAKAVYSRLTGGMALAPAVREARAQIRDAGDPTYLAYTLYGDPGARVEPD